MIIKDLFKKPIDRNIQGVVTIGNETEVQKQQELEEYVCTKEITNSFRTFFKKYRESIQQPTEKMGVWITGFFGSGKSHFLKILGYILENETVCNKPAVEYFNDKIADSIIMADMKQCATVQNKVVLFNIDSKAKSNSKTDNQAIMDIMLRCFNDSVGLCATQPWIADLERELIKDGVYEDFKNKFKEYSKKEWTDGRNQALLNRDHIIKALVDSKNMSLESANIYFREETLHSTKSTEEFAKIVNEYCEQTKTRVIFLMDEVGQFIGNNGALMLNLQTCVEDLGKFCKGKAWVVVTSQQHLKDMIDANKNVQDDFSKIQGRFDTRILLSGSNADEVIKKRILEKNDQSISPLKGMYEQYKTKLNNLIIFEAKPTWSGYKDEDEFKDVYPFVSYQFTLLQKVFEAIRDHGMTEGKHLSQNERSLLSAFQESAKSVANENTGILVPFDSFYSTVKNFIDYPIQTVFTNAERNPSLNPFDLRVLKILFMIKHVKEMPATIDRLATLMVGSVNEDKLVLKANIDASLKRLEEETLVQRNGTEFDFLTNEEQDVNRQIGKTAFNEAEILRTVSEIIYDRILDSNKYRYKARYDFPLNRYVDDEIKGSYNPDNITIKVITSYNNQGLDDETSFLTESIRANGIIIDLREGNYFEELIKASRIENFKRNNSATMSSSLAEIMDKKTREASERRKRAEDIIKASLRKAGIYANSSNLEIKEKEGKDRINEAIEKQINSTFYKLGYVVSYYNTANDISIMLNDRQTSFDLGLESDSNYQALKEILEKLKDNKAMHRRSSVKQLTDIFSRAPYGWKDLDIRGMIGLLFKKNLVKIVVHDNAVSINDGNFKFKFAKGEDLDQMIVSIQEKIDDNILYQVKKIMKDAYDETCPIQEEPLKEAVLDFFNTKKNNLKDIQVKYGPGPFAGKQVLSVIHSDFDSITRSNDNLTIFNTIISKEQSLKDNALYLEQIETFYRENSSQMKNYKDAEDICNWYNRNQLLEDLSSLDEVITKLEDILKMELPFDKMTELGSLVSQSKTIQEKMKKEKVEAISKSLSSTLSDIEKEKNEALILNISDNAKTQIESKFEELKSRFKQWFDAINNCDFQQLDSYKNAGERELEGFRRLIGTLLIEPNPEADPNETATVSTKRIKVSSLIPVANKRIRTKEDVEKVVQTIKEKLLSSLSEVDELDIE